MSVLDPEYTSEVLFVLNELKRQGVQMILVTHEMGLARNACEKAAFLQSGVLVKWGNGEKSIPYSRPHKHRN